MEAVEVTRGDSPIVLGIPHAGTYVPETIRNSLTPLAQTLADTDWHVDRLYADLLDGASTVKATFHRYVIDANRDPSGESLYPGQNTTTLVPLTDFDGVPLWKVPPSSKEIEQRKQDFHAPYHAALEAELERVRQRHGIAVLYDCHSIRSGIPFLFEGTLPDFSIGTNNGLTCAAEFERSTARICHADKHYSTVVNGRFKGGWTTRHYGRPLDGLHAIQMELTQSTYLDSESAPFDFSHEKADRLRITLQKILEALHEHASSMTTKTDGKT